MNIERQKEVFKEAVADMERIMFEKGNDYANEDRLSNFKLAGSIVGSNAELNCLNLIATKVARLGVLLNSRVQPNNESINDSLIDLANYALLLMMIRNDREPIAAKAAAAAASSVQEYKNYSFRPIGR